MARAFRRRGRGDGVRYVASLDEDERAIVGDLMGQVAELLAPPARTSTGDDSFDAVVAGMTFGDDTGASDVPDVPRDPALDRLLPTAHRDDADAAAEFRRLTEGGLRDRKARALTTAAAALRGGDDVTLDAAEAPLFLTALTDVRLVLGDRLGLESDEDLDLLEARVDRLDATDPLTAMLGVYDFLTWLQETLASALLGD
ncbi:DUF2017 domain-containing protein [Phycicoccus sp. BSK3Z-2]|uniref:DUF2017 domain-containing protein n=1 Tax=Phycicoccus avicenniae TaxID=2828860 RepID=A0A941D6U1_9MICO|nr:DUF2017 domain-containing protein [Phycicoccus avicenniae]MBR7742915.1 DUF2017 domain-containing protein [Phycicoccus avicenniae]